ncbi:hypothetical protein HJC23_000870 [Cyclotella cryptica]|uniref:Uncharacterized protein n=1 Tax=Cyclotella cryptica TaxID=29204 RepID=A0ABD3PTU0_9STRA|eukprot:CCRYP_011589-RA/>CCRYP_011589-RA protein AED:0.49 eAED:0.49 QI:0/-1/0/1/-1/1/1/0/59
MSGRQSTAGCSTAEENYWDANRETGATANIAAEYIEPDVDDALSPWYLKMSADGRNYRH